VDWAARLDFLRGSQAVGCVNAQALETRRGRLSAGIVDADVAFECGVHTRPFINGLRGRNGLTEYPVLQILDSNLTGLARLPPSSDGFNYSKQANNSFTRK
jgi:hypothetical protein